MKGFDWIEFAIKCTILSIIFVPGLFLIAGPGSAINDVQIVEFIVVGSIGYMLSFLSCFH